MYDPVQEQYWGVGVLKHWQLQQVRFEDQRTGHMGSIGADLPPGGKGAWLGTASRKKSDELQKGSHKLVR